MDPQIFGLRVRGSVSKGIVYLVDNIHPHLKLGRMYLENILFILKFVQLLAPVSLLCVILSIMACFAGGIEKAITYNGQQFI